MPKTSTGFEFEIIPDVFDDWEFVELLAEVNGGNGLKVPAVIERLIGTEGVKALKEHCRTDGRVKTSAMNAEIAEIMTAAGGNDDKNKKN